MAEPEAALAAGPTHPPMTLRRFLSCFAGQGCLSPGSTAHGTAAATIDGSPVSADSGVGGHSMDSAIPPHVPPRQWESVRERELTHRVMQAGGVEASAGGLADLVFPGSTVLLQPGNIPVLPFDQPLSVVHALWKPRNCEVPAGRYQSAPSSIRSSNFRCRPLQVVTLCSHR